MKLLIVVGVVAGLLWWLLVRPRRGAPPGSRKPAKPAATVVACEHCGVHVPAGDAVMDGARAYCSDAHRLAGPRRPDAP